MIDIELKRDFVLNMYPGQAWKKRVRKMSETQIVAIYMKNHQVSKVQTAKRNLDYDNPPF